MKSFFKKFLICIAIIIAAISAFFIYADIESASVVPVLMYHSFNPNDEANSLYVLPSVFQKQMKFLARHNYNVVAPDKVIAYMKKEEKMPSKTVAITADDGFHNFYKYAYPVLKQYNLKATIFVVTDKIGRPGRLGWKELREMSDSGLITIGSHTKTHSWLPAVSVDEKWLYNEIVLSKSVLENGLGKKVDYLCYPNGGFNDAIKEAAAQAGYKGAFTTNPTRYSDVGDVYAIRRLKMSSSSVNPFILWGKISRYYAWFKERR